MEKIEVFSKKAGKIMSTKHIEKEIYLMGWTNNTWQKIAGWKKPNVKNYILEHV